MTYGILPKLTKDYIENLISQETIFKKYLRTDDLQEGEKYCSPFDPFEEEYSFTVKYGNTEKSQGKLRGVDWGGDFRGDCYDLVARLYGYNANSKDGFVSILHQIAKDFKIHKYGNESVLNDDNIARTIDILNRSRKVKIECRYRQYNKHDTTWINLGVTYEKLKKFNIGACQRIYLNGNEYPIYTYSYNDPAYAYLSLDEPDDIKIYFPNRDKRNKRRPRFLSNNHAVQGLKQIESAPFGIITKAYKDVVALNMFKVNGQEIQSVAPSAESIFLTPSQVDYLRTKWNKIYSLFDYDPAGLHAAFVYRKLYNIEPLFIKLPSWNKKIRFPIKDFSDYRNHNGLELTQKLITDTYNKLTNNV